MPNVLEGCAGQPNTYVSLYKPDRTRSNSQNFSVTFQRPFAVPPKPIRLKNKHTIQIIVSPFYDQNSVLFKQMRWYSIDYLELLSKLIAPAVCYGSSVQNKL